MNIQNAIKFFKCQNIANNDTAKNYEHEKATRLLKCQNITNNEANNLYKPKMWKYRFMIMEIWDYDLYFEGILI